MTLAQRMLAVVVDKLKVNQHQFKDKAVVVVVVLLVKQVVMVMLVQ
jgi:hypothetical protein